MIVTPLALLAEKKHSVRFDCPQPDAAITALYISKKFLPSPYPTALISVIFTQEEFAQFKSYVSGDEADQGG